MKVDDVDKPTVEQSAAALVGYGYGRFITELMGNGVR